MHVTFKAKILRKILTLLILLPLVVLALPQWGLAHLKCATTLNKGALGNPSLQKSFEQRGQGYDPLGPKILQKSIEQIHQKNLSKDELTLEELRLLYEMDFSIGPAYERAGLLYKMVRSFSSSREAGISPHGNNALVQKIRASRDFKQDLARIHNVEPHEVSDDFDDFFKPGTIKVFYGDLWYQRHYKLSALTGLIAIHGHANFFNVSQDLQPLSSLTYIGGHAFFQNFTTAEGLSALTYIGGDANFRDIRTAKGLSALTHIGGNANFRSIKTAKGLSALTHIGGNANFKNLWESWGLFKLEYIGGKASFNNLKEAWGLSGLEHIGGDASFNSLKDSWGLSKLEYIEENASFNRLKEAHKLSSLRYIGGHANFVNLKEANGLFKLEYIGENANFPLLQEATDDLPSLKYIGGLANFPKLNKDWYWSGNRSGFLQESSN